MIETNISIDILITRGIEELYKQLHRPPKYIIVNNYTYNMLVKQLDYMTVYENDRDPVPRFHGIEILIRKDNKKQINIEVI